MLTISEIIKNNEQLMDHTEHFHGVLEKFKEVVSKNDKPILEVGTRAGGSALCFLNVLKYLNKKNWMFSVDPYGTIPYHDGNSVHQVSPYSNELYRKAMANIYAYCAQNQLNFQHFKITSLDFINLFFDNKELIIYHKGKKEPLSEFSFIYLDGSHDPIIVKAELNFFAKYLTLGGAIIVDDYYGERFDGFWDDFFKQNPQLRNDKTLIPTKIVLEYR